MTYMNATTSISSMASISPTAIFILVFIISGLLIFLISKNFRKIIIGAALLIPIIIVGLISRYISNSYGAGNKIPLNTFAYLSISILISFIIGHLASLTKWYKKIANKL